MKRAIRPAPGRGQAPFRPNFGTASLARRLGVLLVTALVCHGTLSASQPEAGHVKFDSDMLKARGIDPATAVYFSQAARFRPGTSPVTLTVNGMRKGTVDARFGTHGELCFDRELLDRAGLRVPGELPAAPPANVPAAPDALPPRPAPSAVGSSVWPLEPNALAEDGASVDIAAASHRGGDRQGDGKTIKAPRAGDAPARGDTPVAPAEIDVSVAGDATANARPACYDYRLAYPQTVVTLHPNEAAIELIVPGEALRAPETTLSGYTTGGTAALLNYDIQASDNRAWGKVNRYAVAATDVGFNSGDWLVRSRQTFTQLNGKSSWNYLHTYVQRTFVDARSIMQAGEITLGSSLFAGIPLHGVQLMPERALTEAASASAGAVVRGIAQTQARVEVHQNGSLVYSTLVPPGPFVLDRLPLLSGTGDLQVTVIEATGERRQFTVPAASFMNHGIGAPQGFSVAVGKVRRPGGKSVRRGRDMPTPWVLSANRGWALSRNINAATGLLVTNHYQALGLSLDARLMANATAAMRVLLTRDNEQRATGTQITGGLNARLSENLSASLSATLQTSGYRGPLEQPQRVRAQYTASLAWNAARAGGMMLSYSRATSSNAGQTSRFFGSWSNTFGPANVSFNAEHETGARRPRSAVYINLSLSLGKRYVSGFASQTGDTTRYGARFSENVSETLNYNASVTSTSDARRAALTANLNYLPRYTQLGVGYGYFGAGSHAFSASVRGSAVAHRGGVTFSPYPVQDTFGIVSVGEIAGAKIHTPSGPAWTDAWGRAVVPALPAYSEAQLQLATTGLPRNIDVKNGSYTLKAGHGSVNFVDFEVSQVRRLLLNVTLPDGRMPAKGASVVDSRGNFVTAVNGKGKIFLNQGKPKSALRVKLDEQRHCELRFTVPEKFDAGRYFEAVDAVCQPLAPTAAAAEAAASAATNPTEPLHENL
ncbi:fimbria/pilus outer membrane usher protein [Pandoraea sp.]|uniref:fimbria/pilus outer membrane usher protein n=1 Tax=Pandoraea sp. TaxID=1883445 RepID=UPI001203C9F0|nr:fimbria/pilus outer membrane usher protein [Pandoraea sp.]TAL54755.1 MAG: pilus assembly protein PapC [Pandoraea sp.]TAM18477.1 MAG: pilus assembly protein PapC [Pandoraea sp.]